MTHLGSKPSNRDVAGSFDLSAQAVVITSGGIGGNHDIVRRYWRMGTAEVDGHHVDGRMLDIARTAVSVWSTTGSYVALHRRVQNWDPIWPSHAIRILPGPSSMWFDALGRRLPQPYLPGYDTLGTLRYLRTTPEIAGYDPPGSSSPRRS